jgi:protoheme IX farnesyltransferase
MLPIVDPSGDITGRQAVAHALALVPVALLPTAIGLAGPIYFVGALLLGGYYLAASVRFCRDVNEVTAKKLLKASIIHLPLTLGLLLLNPLPV